MSNTRSDYILIGRNASGEKIYVRAELRYQPDHTPGIADVRQTVDHQDTTDRLTLSVSGVVVSKYGSIDRDGSWVGAGQCLGDLLSLTMLADGWTVRDVAKLHELWTRWHLNDMRAACAHQTPGVRQGKFGPESFAEDCPVTGYKYGSAWLVESLPYDAFAWFSEHFGIEPPEPGSQEGV